jgi:F-type H+-transporting ATPase subunit b
MKRGHKSWCRIGLWVIGLLLLPGLAWAAEGSQDWRPIYDLILRWVNFLILAGVLFKFGRRPISSFLKGEKLQIQVEIEELEEKKRQKLESVAEAEAALVESDDRFAKMTERIIADGERRKKEIIESAKAESQRRLDEAQRRVQGQIVNARRRIHSELVDSALQLALERLPELVTEDDNRRRNVHFLDQIQQG